MMEHKDHVGLLSGGIGPRDAANPPPVWADLGAGDGAFTLALADLLELDARIIAVDRDGRALRRLADAMGTRFPQVRLETVTADFTGALDLPRLDGVVMANALHFVADGHKDAVLQKIRGYLRPGGRLLMVEYDADSGNPWVPHPFAYGTWEGLALRAGFVGTRRLATVPSRFLGAIYSAVSFAP
jgi:SAM-dependent methyltransferase